MITSPRAGSRVPIWLGSTPASCRGYGYAKAMLSGLHVRLVAVIPE